MYILNLQMDFSFKKYEKKEILQSSKNGLQNHAKEYHKAHTLHTITQRRKCPRHVDWSSAVYYSLQSKPPNEKKDLCCFFTRFSETFSREGGGECQIESDANVEEEARGLLLGYATFQG